MPIANLNRAVIRLSGEGVHDWLSGLITNSIDQDLNFAALLSPQGKIIADFFVFRDDASVLLDTAAKFSDTLQKRLSMYRLRAPIVIEKTDLNVYAAWSGTGDEGYMDPRHPDLGHRIYTEAMTTEQSDEDYDLHRLSLGIPDSTYDFESAELFPANTNMDLLSGVDFKKGCFVGQEVVSRMHRKTKIKKRLRGFRFEGPLSEDTIKLGDRTVGDILHSRAQAGMALLRQDRLPDGDVKLKAGQTDIKLLD